MNATEEKDIIERLRSGDKQAFEKLYEEYKKMVLYMAYDLTGVMQEAEDIMQETFTRVYTGIKKFRGESSLKTWIFKIMLNLCRSSNRRKKVASFFGISSVSRDGNEEYSIDIGINDDHADNIYHRQRLRAVRNAIIKLPGRQKEVFVMKHLKEMKISEIADVLGSPEGTVKANLFKAVQSLRNMLKGMEK